MNWADHRHYTWSAMLDAVEHGKPQEFRSSFQSHMAAPTKTWDLSCGFAGALDMACGKVKWKAGQRSIEQTAREQAQKVLLKRPLYEYGYDVEGIGFDIEAVIEGRPECWLTQQATGHGEAALVRIVVDLSTSASVTAATIAERMSAIAAACLVIETTNPIEVIVIDQSTACSLPMCVAIQINNAGEPIDSQRLVTAAHPAFFRRLCFRLQELTLSKEVSDLNSWSYGSARAMTSDMVLDLWGPNAIYIPSLMSGDMAPTCDALLKIVQQKLGSIGSDDSDETMCEGD